MTFSLVTRAPSSHLPRAAVPFAALAVFAVTALGCSGTDPAAFGEGQGGGGGNASGGGGDPSSAEQTTVTGSTAIATGTASSAQTGTGGDDASSTGPGQGGANQGGAGQGGENQGGDDTSGPGGGAEPGCGDDACDDDESCDECPEDCGECPDSCGNDTCDDDETCETCEDDCGPCADECEEHDECDDDEVCAGGTCQEARGRTYVFTVVSATFPVNDPGTDTPWDPVGLPDPFVEICTSAQCPAGTTTTKDDQSNPTWNETFSQTLDDDSGAVWFTMWDEDINLHDFALETPVGSAAEWIDIVRDDDGLYVYESSPGLSLTIAVRPM